MPWSSSWFIGLILLSLLVFIIVLFNDPKDLDSSFDRGRWNERSKTGQCKTADPRPGVKWRLKCKVQNTDPFCLENGNTINLKSLYSLHFCLLFTPGRQSAVRSPQSAVYILHWPVLISSQISSDALLFPHPTTGPLQSSASTSNYLTQSSLTRELWFHKHSKIALSVNRAACRVAVGCASVTWIALQHDAFRYCWIRNYLASHSKTMSANMMLRSFSVYLT